MSMSTRSSTGMKCFFVALWKSFFLFGGTCCKIQVPTGGKAPFAEKNVHFVSLACVLAHMDA